VISDSDDAATDRRFEGAVIPTSAHAGDDGGADPELAAVLTALAAGQCDHRSLQHALVGRRLLLPTRAVLEESSVDDVTGLEHEKSSHMAAAVFRSDAGWSGMLVFTGIPAVHLWSVAARPVPVTADEAAAAALEDGCDALVFDIAGPHRAVLAGSLLRALAQSRVALSPAQDPIVIELIHQRAAEVEGIANVQVFRADEVPEIVAASHADGSPLPDAVVVLTPDPGVDPQVAATDLARALAGESVVRDRLEAGLAFVLAGASTS